MRTKTLNVSTAKVARIQNPKLRAIAKSAMTNDARRRTTGKALAAVYSEAYSGESP